VLRSDDGKLRVRIVDAHEKMVVDVPPVDYANIGFDGKWTTASQLLDPEQIKRMKASSRNAPAGTRWYEGGSRDAKVQVLWDEKDRYPPHRIRQCQRHPPQHHERHPRAMPAVMPWTRLNGYAQKEYSDLLD
jgi:hypothetical protein